MSIARNISRLVAMDVINELYEVAKLRPQIMVVNWLGFAYYEICHQLNTNLDSKCPDIDKYLDADYMSEFIKEFIKINPYWPVLNDWHFFHWNRSQLKLYEDEYAIYLNMTKLELPHYTLTV